MKITQTDLCGYPELSNVLDIANMTNLASTSLWAKSLKRTYQLPAHTIESDDPDELQARTEFFPIEIIAAMNLKNSDFLITCLYAHYRAQQMEPFRGLLQTQAPESDHILLNALLLQTKHLDKMPSFLFNVVFKKNTAVVISQAAKYKNFNFLAYQDSYDMDNFLRYQIEQLKAISAKSAITVTKSQEKLYYHILRALIDEPNKFQLNNKRSQRLIQLILRVPACNALVINDLLKSDLNDPLYQACTQNINNYTAILLNDANILNAIQIKNIDIESKSDVNSFLTELAVIKDIEQILKDSELHMNLDNLPSVLTIMNNRQLSATQLTQLNDLILRNMPLWHVYSVIVKYAVEHNRWDVVEHIGSNGLTSIGDSCAADAALKGQQFTLAQRLIDSFLQTYHADQDLNAADLIRTLLPQLNKIPNIS